MRLKMRPEMNLMMGLMMASTVSGYSRNDYYGRTNECYKEVRRGLRVEASHVDKYVKSGSLIECERACDIAFFTCKGFSYSDYHTREPENCLLTRETTHTLDINDPRDFYKDPDFVFFEKTSGRDCDYEIDHTSNRYPADNYCYELIKTRERIASRYVIKVLKTRDRQECEEECNRVRECRGFNYRYKTLGYNQYRDNCELSSRNAGDYHDFQIDDDFDFYEQSNSQDCRYSNPSGSNHGSNYGTNYGSNYGTNYGSNHGNNYYGGSGSGHTHGGSAYYRDECFRLAKTETTIENRVVRERLEVRDIGACELECKRARYFTCKTYAFRYTNSYHAVNCLLSDREYRELTHYDLISDREFDFYERRLYDRECGEETLQDNTYTPQSHHHADTTDYGDASDVTVTGARCHRDRCREDRQAGYYFCETDFSGAWDYCCRPRELCGFSEGYDKKWCYVGVVGRDQWRPCTGQGPGREYLKEEHPDFGDYIGAPSGDNATEVQVIDLNEIV